ncbi:hypothetical protein ACP4OV_003832 [Aristida adscensionis]
MYQNVVQNNLSVFGGHPKKLLEKGHPVDLTGFTSLTSSSTSSTILRFNPPRHSELNISGRELPKVMFRELVAGTAILPKEKFEMVWESRLPPYQSFVNLATYCDGEKISQHYAASPSNKRQRFDM